MKDEALEALRKANEELAADNAKRRKLVVSLQHTVGNLTSAAQYYNNEIIESHCTDKDTGQTMVIKSRRHTMYIRNLLYGRL